MSGVIHPAAHRNALPGQPATGNRQINLAQVEEFAALVHLVELDAADLEDAPAVPRKLRTLDTWLRISLYRLDIPQRTAVYADNAISAD